MSVRGTMIERMGVSSSSKTLWIISRSSRSTMPSRVPTSTSVRSSSSDSSVGATRPRPTSRTTRALNPARNARTGDSSVPSPPTGRSTILRNGSGCLTATVMGKTSPNVVRSTIIMKTSTSTPHRLPKRSTATVAARAAAPMFTMVMPTSSVTRSSCGRVINGSPTLVAPPSPPRWRSRARPREK